ncbi:PKD domain-containing protein [Ekhidna sp.]
MRIGFLRRLITVLLISCVVNLLANETCEEVPTASFAVGSPLCQFTPVTFTNTSSTTVGQIILYRWQFGDGEESSEENPTHTYDLPNTYTVRLTVLDSEGEFDEFETDIVIQSAPVVDFDIDLTDNCSGTTQTFTGSASGSILSSDWDYGDGFGSSGMNGSRDFTEAGTYEVTFTVVSTSNCSNSITKEITIYEEPVAGFTFESVCDQEAIQFNNTSTITTGNLTYSWDFDDGDGSTLANPSHIYDTPGDYDVVLTVTSTDGMCDTQTMQTVTIHPNPVSSFTAPAICLGSATTFTNNSTGVNLSAEWNFGDGNTSIDFNTTHTYASSGSYIVSLEVTSDDGCKDKSERRVDIYDDPVPTFFVEDNCLLNSVAFSNLTNTEGDTYTYAWDFGDPLVMTDVSTDENPSYTYGSTGTYTVTLTATTSTMCSATYQQDVVISPHPSTNFTFVDGCKGEENTFTSTSTIAAGNTIETYTWDFGDGGSSIGATTTHTYLEPGVFDVKLTTISYSGCEDELIQQITIYDDPAPDFSFDGACDGNEITFTNESTVLGGGSLNYTWDFGDGPPSTTSNLVSPTHTYASQGIYTVTLTVRHNVPAGCEAVIQKNVEIFQDLTSSFTVDPECLGDAVTFDNTSIGTGLSFLWNFGDGNTSTQFEPSHTYASPGSYITTLLVTSNDGCTRISEERVDIYADPIPVFFVEDNCLLNSVAFSNLTNTEGDTYTYAWDFGDPMVITDVSTDENPSYTYGSVGAYTVRLTATTSNGCVAFYEGDVVIWDHPEANFDIPNVAFAVSDGCEGVVVELPNTTTIAAGQSIASYVWDFGDGSGSTSEIGSHSYDEPGVYDVSLTAVSTNGCEDQIIQQVTITGKPVPDFFFGGTCEGNVVEFLNESTVSEGNLTYIWDFGDGSATNNEIDPTHEYATQGTYTVTLEARNNSGGCFTIVTKEVEIFQELTSDFGFTSVCFGEEVVFDNTSIGTGVDFLWNFGDGNTSTFFEPNHLYESPGSYIVNLLVTSSDGCTRTSERRVDIYENPTPVFFFDNSCELNEVQFTNLTDESIGSLSYMWDFGDGNNSTEREPAHVFEEFGTYTVSLTVTTGDNCQTMISNTIEIYEIPVADFTIADVCFGFTSEFTDQSTGVIESYLWDFGDLTNSTSENPVKQYLSPGTYNVTLTIVSSNGCTNSMTKQAIVNELPVADFDATDVCVGEPTVFTNKSIDNSSTSTFQWNFGDGATSIAQNPTHTYSLPGNYAVDLTITSSEGCVDATSKLVIVFDLPEADAGQDTTISRGASVQLQATGGVSYQWSPITNLDNSTVANPIARPLENTVYTVTVTDDNGCQSTDQVMVSLREDFQVVATNVFTPDGNGQNDQWVIPNVDAFDQVQVKVYDRYGVLVFEDNDYQNNWEGTRGTDILPDGTYYYLITFPGTDINYSGALTLLRNR